MILDKDLVGITMLIYFFWVEVDMFRVVSYYGLANKIIPNFDRGFHDSYLIKCLHNNIAQNDTIW